MSQTDLASLKALSLVECKIIYYPKTVKNPFSTAATTETHEDVDVAGPSEEDLHSPAEVFSPYVPPVLVDPYRSAEEECLSLFSFVDVSAGSASSLGTSSIICKDEHQASSQQHSPVKKKMESDELVPLWSGTWEGRQVRMLRKENVLGKGAVGTVYSGKVVMSIPPDSSSSFSTTTTMMEASIDVAIKSMTIDEEMAHVLSRTAKTFRKRIMMSHPCVLNIYLAVTSPCDPSAQGGEVNRDSPNLFPFHLYTALERAPHGSLAELLKKKERLGEEQIRHVLTDIVSAVAYVHSTGIVHNDVKPHNILIFDRDAASNSGIVGGGFAAAAKGPRYRYKLGDFGVAQFRVPVDMDHTLECEPAEFLRNSAESGAFLGTAIYMSPESCIGINTSASSDVWAIGITAFYMAVGRVPWNSMEANYPSIIMNGFREKYSHGLLFRDSPNAKNADSFTNFGPVLGEIENSTYSPEIRDFVKSCLVEHPDHRPSANQLLKHPFITGRTLADDELRGSSKPSA